MEGKEPCMICGESTRSYLVYCWEVLKKDQHRDYICHKCIDTYLDDHSVDVLMEYSLGKEGTKWEGTKFFEKAIIIDGPLNNLLAYSHRASHSWKNLYHSARVWYNTSKQEEVGDIVSKYFNKSKNGITPSQLKCISTFISRGEVPDTRDSIHKEFNVESISDLTKDEASKLIDRMMKVRGIK